MYLLLRIALCLLFILQAPIVFSSDGEEMPTITVLPFEVSEEGDYAYLNKAIDQMLLARLSRFKDIKIVTAPLGDEEIRALQQEVQAGKLAEVRQKLRGSWLLEPSMYSLKDGMQINLSLTPLQGGRPTSFAEKIDSRQACPDSRATTALAAP